MCNKKYRFGYLCVGRSIPNKFGTLLHVNKISNYFPCIIVTWNHGGRRSIWEQLRYFKFTDFVMGNSAFTSYITGCVDNLGYILEVRRSDEKSLSRFNYFGYYIIMKDIIAFLFWTKLGIFGHSSSDILNLQILWWEILLSRHI
jgi:hypothetical protein